jgi:CheY-like chemotaxis protein
LFSINERVGFIGGRLEIDSSPGNGARFTLFAPLSSGEAVQPSAGPQRRKTDQTTPEVLDGKIRLVLVDDHSVIRSGLARVLGAEQDMEVVGEAESGQAAVDLVDKVLPHTVLMDINMPGMDGIAATRLILQRHPGVHVIGLSFYSNEERAQEMLRAGATRYVSKTASADELKTAIRSCMERKLSKAG